MPGVSEVPVAMTVGEVIDIYDRGDEYLMVIKDEADGQKNLRALVQAGQ